MSLDQFSNLDLKSELLTTLIELQFDSMTPIQAQSLPPILLGKDVLAQAKTGSGKTAAFGLGILNRLEIDDSRIQALVLCPTRELAEQVAKEIRTLARKLSNVKVLTLCGGVAERFQEQSLAHGAHIVVGTPGRVLKLLTKEALDLRWISFLILDEADRMLDMGFLDDIEEIVSYIPENIQSLLFSATYPQEIMELSKNLQREAIAIRVDTDHEAATIEQVFFELTRHQDKPEALLRILGKYQPNRFIVFCKTKQITEDVANLLKQNNIAAASIHGDLEQNERTSVLTQFTNNSLSALVATDVAARGLDIEDLAAVINFDIPSDPDIYIHRIGRTGRAGKSGLALTLFVEKSGHIIEAIEEVIKAKCQIEDAYALPEDVEYHMVPPMKTMFIGGGKRDKLRPGDILGALSGEAQLKATDVGDINILKILSYVAIKREVIDKAVENLRQGKIKGRKFKVGLADENKL